MLYSSAIQYVIFLVTTGVILPYIDRIGRRLLLLSGSIICMALHYAIAGIMATYGNPVDEIDGNKNLRFVPRLQTLWYATTQLIMTWLWMRPQWQWILRALRAMQTMIPSYKH